MRTAGVVGVFVAGLALGALAVALSGPVLSRLRPPKAPTLAELDAMPTKELGRTLMARVGERFLHRRSGAIEYGAAFYDAPKPYGASLCRVNSYRFPEKIVRGRQRSEREFWDDDLEITTLYGVWKRPTAPDDPQRTREAACAQYRDFDHLIHGEDGTAVQRVVYLVDVAMQAAKSGDVGFKLTCVDKRYGGRAGRPCDGLAELRSMDLTRLGSVQNISESHANGLASWTDDVLVRFDRGQGVHPEILSYEIKSVQTYGREGWREDVVSIDIKYQGI